MMDSEDYKVNEAVFLERLEKIAGELEAPGDVVIKLGGKEESQALNKQFREKDYPTDVLSFVFDEETPEGYYLGDIFICYPVAEEQAKENGISPEQELFTLMVHGLMHLAGYDHETDEREMLNLQAELLDKYGINTI